MTSLNYNSENNQSLQEIAAFHTKTLVVFLRLAP